MKHFHIKIVGDKEICSFVVKNSTLEVAKEKIKGLAGFMNKPYSAMIFEDHVKVYDYIKR